MKNVPLFSPPFFPHGLLRPSSTPTGLTVDGRRRPWDVIQVRSDNSTGDVVISTLGTVVGEFHMMDDNVIPAIDAIVQLQKAAA